MKEPVIKYRPMRTVNVVALCPRCRSELTRSPIILIPYSAKYVYSCNGCEYELTTSEMYPRIDFVEEHA